jgi:2-C-methyl-D-erythritol 4-phosphate cytidylyltransferase
MKKYAVIVAGGSGSRMNSSLPKQFLLLSGKPVLYYTLSVFLKAYKDLQAILVLPKEYISTGEKITQDFFNDKQIQITSGGNTRFHSVQNGLKLVKEESIVFVHDGVRCLVTESLIKSCYEAAMQFGSAIPAIPSKDSIRIINGQHSQTIDRTNIRLIQTPQTFQSNILLPAFETTYKPSFTDEATVVEASGSKINLIEGEENNIKITKPIDIIIAEKILQSHAADNKNNYL